MNAVAVASLALAVIFVLLAAYRVSPSATNAIGQVTMVAGVIAGALAILHWRQGFDSRWLVGGVLLIVGAGSLQVSNARGVKLGGLVVGAAGAVLAALAYMTRG